MNCPTTKMAYDANGNLASTTDPNGNTTRYVYNLAGRQTQVIDALGDTTTAVYDAVGNVLAVTNALGGDDVHAIRYDESQGQQVNPLPSDTVRSPWATSAGTPVGGGPTTTWTIRPQRQRHQP